MIHKKVKDALTNEIYPEIPNDVKKKLASVLIIIYGEKPEILMTKKPATMAQHGGEISFPGGKLSEGDNDLLETALRETREETGLEISRKVKIFGYRNVDLKQFDQQNIEKLLKKNLLEKKLIKPIYLS